MLKKARRIDLDKQARSQMQNRAKLQAHANKRNFDKARQELQEVKEQWMTLPKNRKWKGV